MTHISYQLYCSRNFPPLAGTLKMLAAAGFKEVEGYGGVMTDMSALKSDLDANGLAMTSCHMGIDDVEGDVKGTLAKMQALGTKKLFVPHLMPDARPTDAKGWAAFGKRLAEAGKPYQDAGLTFGWHNHDFELIATDSGEMPIELIAGSDDNLMLELDLGWVRVAGQDPVAWINKYAGRLAAVHVKDIAPDGENTDEDGWADIGHGIMDWPSIHAALRATGVDHYVAEHDNPADHTRFATRSIATLKSL